MMNKLYLETPSEESKFNIACSLVLYKNIWRQGQTAIATKMV